MTEPLNNNIQVCVCTHTRVSNILFNEGPTTKVTLKIDLILVVGTDSLLEILHSEIN